MWVRPYEIRPYPGDRVEPGDRAQPGDRAEPRAEPGGRADRRGQGSVESGSHAGALDRAERPARQRPRGRTVGAPGRVALPVCDQRSDLGVVLGLYRPAGDVDLSSDAAAAAWSARAVAVADVRRHTA